MKDTVRQPDYLNISHYPHSIEFNADFDTWTGKITADQLLDGMYLRSIPQIEYEPCVWLFDGPIIYANGNVGLCGCRDYNADSELIVGNISENPLITIWQSDKVEMLRKRFITGDLPAICKKCTTYSNLDLLKTKVGQRRARLTDERFNESNYSKSIVEQIHGVGVG
jgi:radical SAM protein with 4Fe4S-binding SPASM domain